MPGWHAQTKDRQDAGELQVVGIVQEQHPTRARLFMQWKQMKWPVLVDSLDLLGVSVVPITVLIDEAGVVQKVRARPADLEAFLAMPPPEMANLLPMRSARPDVAALREAFVAENPTALRERGDTLVTWGDDGDLDRATALYDRALAIAPADGPTHFHQGVACRRRFESARRRDGDFGRAIDHWRRALEINPNQYIWRRRIQQYGPRLDKPYPFYDWVHEAREQIAARGETPIDLPVEPSGAEIARPQRTFESTSTLTSPDPEGRIHRDERGFVDVETIVVPHTRGDRRTYRVHLVMRPNGRLKTHWNNETGEALVLWIDPPRGWVVDRNPHTAGPEPAAVSRQSRHIELELQAPPDARSAGVSIPAYALYYVCEDADGACLYRRMDLKIVIDP